jgi:hypothetical protein
VGAILKGAGFDGFDPAKYDEMKAAIDGYEKQAA